MNATPLSEYDLPKHALAALSRLTGRIISGSDEILVSPQFSKISDEDVLNKVDELIRDYDITPGLRQVENSNRDKYGPRSLSVPWSERKESLAAYYNHEQNLYVDDLIKEFEHGVEDSDYPSIGLRPLSVANAISELHRTSNSGLPYMKRKGQVLEEITNDQEKDVAR